MTKLALHADLDALRAQIAASFVPQKRRVFDPFHGLADIGLAFRRILHRESLPR